MSNIKGLHRFTGEEAGNIGLGQTGFKEVLGATNTGDGNFVAIKCIKGSATVSADSNAGDDLGGGTDSGSGVLMISGDIIWGDFSKVKCHTALMVLLVYYGA